MTPTRLDDIQELCDNATLGPWRIDHLTTLHPNSDPTIAIKRPSNSEHGYVEIFRARPNYFDAEFIAASRELVPELLAEVKKLQGDVADLQRLLGRMYLEKLDAQQQGDVE